jgi:hypothetical protein
MKPGLIVCAIVLTSSVAFAQVATDMTALERKVEDAQAAYDRNLMNVDRQERIDIRDELGYLRVMQRRGKTVTRTDPMRLNDRVDRFLLHMNSRTSSSTGVNDRPNRGGNSGSNQGRAGLEIPSGSEVDVRLVTALTSVDRASRTDRKGSLTVEFNRLRIKNPDHDVRAFVTQALESEGIKGEVGRIGAGSAVGAIIGGILGGVKGAVAGILIGGGGVIAAPEGKDVHLPEGTVLRVRFDNPVSLGF